MRKISVVLILTLTLWLGGLGQALAEGGDPPEPVEEAKPTLLPEPDDPPETVRFKAALRLLAGFNQVLLITQSCQRREVWENYQNRNGRTFGHIFGSLKAGGALSRQYRAAVDERAREAAQISLKLSCDALARDIELGAWDLYKAPRFAADYQIFMDR
ncbi:MAG: hypothetical protein LBR11_00135 [Deltaproteobacteria bacterium]|nr:hypothetical protein [Deltaproteobacteria bacterium]